MPFKFTTHNYTNIYLTLMVEEYEVPLLSVASIPKNDLILFFNCLTISEY